MTALSIFIAVPISKTSPRKGRYVRVLPGLFIFSLYSGFLLSLKGSEADKIGSLVLIHMIFFVLSIFLNYINFVRTK
jgi:lipopolysaccharide export system permease protein